MRNVRTLIEGHLATPYLRTGEYQAYLKGLRLFWNGRSRATVQWVSKELVDLDAPTAFLAPLYRLWLEQLAADGDHLSLRLLAEHLFVRAVADPAELTWTALRGLAHLELDDWEACELLAPALLREESNLYCLEYQQRFRLRQWDGQSPLAVVLPRSQLEWSDFFFWQSLAQALLISGEHEELAVLLSRIGEIYPDAPLGDVYAAHLALEGENFEAAVQHGTRLRQCYSRQREFHVLAAYAHLHLRQIDAALAALRIAKRLPGGSRDADVYALLAWCYRERSHRDVTYDDWRRSLVSIRRAQRLYKEAGFPFSEARAIYQWQCQYQEEHNGTGEGAVTLPSRAFKSWAVRLSPRRSHELASVDEHQVDTLVRPSCGRLVANDLVFFLAPVANDLQQRVLALYHVLGRPFWHPYQGQVVVLKLLKRFSEPLLVKLNEQDMRQVGRTSPFADALAGTVALGEESFDVIRQAVSELADLAESDEFATYLARTS